MNDASRRRRPKLTPNSRLTNQSIDITNSTNEVQNQTTDLMDGHFSDDTSNVTMLIGVLNHNGSTEQNFKSYDVELIKPTFLGSEPYIKKHFHLTTLDIILIVLFSTIGVISLCIIGLITYNKVNQNRPHLVDQNNTLVLNPLMVL